MTARNTSIPIKSTNQNPLVSHLPIGLVRVPTAGSLKSQVDGSGTSGGGELNTVWEG